MAVPGGALSEVTRRLQQERDALRQQVDELSTRLGEARAALDASEHERELTQLELLHVQQRGAQGSQRLRERVAQLERELEQQQTELRVAAAARGSAAQKSAALAADLRALEVRVKAEEEKKEVALAEVQLLKDELRALALDRDQLVQRTEADAKRVRELWQQIAREHEVKLAAVSQELTTARQASTTTGLSVAEYQKKLAEMEAVVAGLNARNSELEDRLRVTESDQNRTRERLESEQHRERDMGERHHRLELEVQELKNKCKMARQREEMAVRERDIAVAAAKTATKEADDRTQELLLLKTEFSELVDKHDELQEAYKHKVRHRVQEAKLLAEKLSKEKRYAEELAILRKNEITGYKKVIHAVERKLIQVPVHNDHVESSSSRPIAPEDGANPAKSSLCIYRH